MRAGSVAGLRHIGVQCELPVQIYGSGLFLLLPFVRCRTGQPQASCYPGHCGYVASTQL